jgi:lipopolysaccharide biosynthesis glycosyltransferase
MEPILDRDPIVVVCAADNNYAMPLAVTVRSAIENLNRNDKLRLFIIDGGIVPQNKQKILQSLSSDRCEITFLPVPTHLIEEIEKSHNHLTQKDDRSKVVRMDHISIASYYRLILPELLPTQITKAIYLDCDLAIEGDLRRLWEMELGEKMVLAVQDMGIRYVSAPTGLLNYQELGIPADAKYFNAGVLVIDLQRWRTEQITAKAITYFQQNKEYVRWVDQDVLNALLAGQWGELDPRWNFPPMIGTYSSWQESPFSEEVYNNLIRNPFIIHYITKLKPWNFRQTPFKEYFFKYVDLTAWSGWRLTFWRQLKFKAIREFQNYIHDR